MRTHVLLEIFNKLEKNRVRYCVLRNWEEIEDRSFRDVDLSVPREFENLVERIINEVSVKYGASCSKKDFGVFFSKFLVVANSVDMGVVEIDVHYSEAWRGLKVIDSEEVVSSAKRYNNQFYVADYKHFIASSVCMCIIGYGGFKNKYKQHLLRGIEDDDVTKLISKRFGKFSLFFLKKYCKNLNLRWLSVCKMSMRINVFFKSFLLNPKISGSNTIKFITWRLGAK